MRTRIPFLPSLLALAITSCDGPAGPDEEKHLETREVTVGPALAKCYGVGERSCMVVDGQYFYDGIEGFEYEAGYDYRLRIGKYDPWSGEEPPQDAGKYSYRLLKQLEKTPAPSTPATLSVGPTRVKCAQIDDFCLLIDGAPYDDIVTDFEYEAGFHYTLDANRYGDGRYVLNSVTSKTEATGTGRGDNRGAAQDRVRQQRPGVLQRGQRGSLPQRNRRFPAVARLQLSPEGRTLRHVRRWRYCLVLRRSRLWLSMARDVGTKSRRLIPT